MIRKFFYTVWFVLILCSGMIAICSGAEKYDEDKVKAALTLNIARFTRWPKNGNKAKTTLNFCIIGNHAIQQAFEALQDKTIQNKKTNIIFIYRLKNVESCQIIYIDDLPTNVLIQLLHSVANETILTISSDDHFLQSGGMIKLKKVDNKLKILINLSSVDKAKLMINPRLLNLATIFDEKNFNFE